MSEPTPQFPVFREFVTRYGGDWATWAFIFTGTVFLGVLGAAFGDTIPASFSKVWPPLLAFGVSTFLGGFFTGVMWSDLSNSLNSDQ
jgi:hypothetical protein